MSFSSDEDFNEFWIDVNNQIQKQKLITQNKSFEQEQKEINQMLTNQIQHQQTITISKTESPTSKKEVRDSQEKNEELNERGFKYQTGYICDHKNYENLNKFIDYKFEVHEIKDFYDQFTQTETVQSNSLLQQWKEDQLKQQNEIIEQYKGQRQIEILDAEARASYKARIFYEEEAQKLQKILNERLNQADNEMSNINLLLRDKDLQIAKLTRLLSQQEIFYNRKTESTFELTQQKSSRSLVEKSKEDQTFFQENYSLKLQLESLKDLLAKQQDEIEKLKVSLKEEQQKLRKQEKQSELTLKKQQKQFQKQLEKEQDLHSQTQQKLAQYAEDCKKEFDLKEVIVQKYEQTIENLKSELRTAKYVIQTPRLRNLVFEKLSDYQPYLNDSSNTPKSEQAIEPLSKPAQPKQSRPNTVFARTKLMSSGKSNQHREQMSATTQPRIISNDTGSILTQTIKELSSQPEGGVFDKDKKFRAKKVSLVRFSNKSR